MPWGLAAASGGAVLVTLVLLHLGGTRGESSANRPGVHRRASLQGGALAWARSTWSYLGVVEVGVHRRRHAGRMLLGPVVRGHLAAMAHWLWQAALLARRRLAAPGTLAQRGELFTGQLVEKLWQTGFGDLARDGMKQMKDLLADCDIFSVGSGSLPIQYSIFHTTSANLPLVKVFRPPCGPAAVFQWLLQESPDSVKYPHAGLDRWETGWSGEKKERTAPVRPQEFTVAP